MTNNLVKKTTPHIVFYIFFTNFAKKMTSNNNYKQTKYKQKL